MLQPTFRPQAGDGFGADRSGLWSLEGVSLIALGAVVIWALVAASVHVDLFLGWLYVFVGGMRMLSGAVHRGPGLGWMLGSAAAALAVGLVLSLRVVAGVSVLGTILAVYLLAEALSAFGLSGGAGVRLASARWLSRAAIGDILLAACAVTAAGNGQQGLLLAVVAANLWLEGVTLLVLGHRWEALADNVATRPPRPPPSGSRTYGRPWARSWRRE